LIFDISVICQHMVITRGVVAGTARRLLVWRVAMLDLGLAVSAVSASGHQCAWPTGWLLVAV
jgi:hypothetical protein